MSRGKGQKNAIISQGVLCVCFAPHSQCCLQSATEGTLCQQLPLFLLYPLDGVGDVGSGKEGRLGPDGASKAGGESSVRGRWTDSLLPFLGHILASDGGSFAAGAAREVVPADVSIPAVCLVALCLVCS